MRYRTSEAFRTALEQRLKNEAESGDVALMRLRKHVAFERFLARLAAAEAGGWVLRISTLAMRQSPISWIWFWDRTLKAIGARRQDSGAIDPPRQSLPGLAQPI
jgi:hypothetical protein